MSIQEQYQSYFPEGRVPNGAFCEIKLLDETIYRLDYGTTRPVPIALIVGTNQTKYVHRGYRWIDLFLQFKKLKSFDNSEKHVSVALDTTLMHGIQLAHNRKPMNITYMEKGYNALLFTSYLATIFYC